jgi:hypothetical protein
MYLAGTSKLDIHPTRGKASNKFGLHVNIINIMVFMGVSKSKFNTL